METKKLSISLPQDIDQAIVFLKREYEWFDQRDNLASVQLDYRVQNQKLPGGVTPVAVVYSSGEYITIGNSRVNLPLCCELNVQHNGREIEVQLEQDKKSWHLFINRDKKAGFFDYQVKEFAYTGYFSERSTYLYFESHLTEEACKLRLIELGFGLVSTRVNY